MDNPYKVPTIEDLLSDIGEHDAPLPAEVPEVRVENENFLEEVNEEESVDAMLDSLFEDED